VPIQRTRSHTAARNAYREDSLGWALIGLIGLLAALGLLLDPSGSQASAAQRELHGPLQAAWNVGWAIGGALIVWGVLSIRPRTELLGQMFFGVAVLIDAIATATVPRPPLPGVALAFIAAIFCALRVRFLARRLEPRATA
jgi:cell division protein FtsW (lipid II flippase)